MHTQIHLSLSVSIHLNHIYEHIHTYIFIFSPLIPFQPKYSENDIEEQLQINHLSHFLLCSLLLPDMQKAKDARMIIVGSITGM